MGKLCAHFLFHFCPLSVCHALTVSSFEASLDGISVSWWELQNMVNGKTLVTVSVEAFLCLSGSGVLANTFLNFSLQRFCSVIVENEIWGADIQSLLQKFKVQIGHVVPALYTKPVHEHLYTVYRVQGKCVKCASFPCANTGDILLAPNYILCSIYEVWASCPVLYQFSFSSAF